jgi:hypothetical protein
MTEREIHERIEDLRERLHELYCSPEGKWPHAAEIERIAGEISELQKELGYR